MKKRMNEWGGRIRMALGGASPEQIAFAISMLALGVALMALAISAHQSCQRRVILPADQVRICRTVAGQP